MGQKHLCIAVDRSELVCHKQGLQSYYPDPGQPRRAARRESSRLGQGDVNNHLLGGYESDHQRTGDRSLSIRDALS
jgi:hypothetical protein